VKADRPNGPLLPWWQCLAGVVFSWTLAVSGRADDSSAPVAAPDATAVAGQTTDVRFETDIRPLLKTHCFHCHGEEPTIEGNLDLRLTRTMLKGGDSGAAITPGNVAESLLIQRITRGEMPPGGKPFPAADLALLTGWIEQGALTARPEPESISADNPWTDEERAYWAWQPVTRPPLPTVRHADRVATPIDRFLLARLEQDGLAFSPEADRGTLIRRLSFDLLGLPPAPELVAEVLADPAPDWYERLVDRLLDSPAYGERWARHWLDPAGYADSDGYTEDDRERPWVYRYRDYVIRSLNADKPLDEFIVEQLAGDELLNGAPPHESQQNTDRLVATGFLRMAPDGTGEGGVDQNIARNDVMAETIKIVSSTLLGVTVGCAQCHEHRYDPIAQADYYRLRAIFEPALDWKNWREKNSRLVLLWTPADYEQAAKIDEELRAHQTQREMELDAIVTEIFERETAKLPAEQQAIARAGRPLPADQRTAEQTQLFKDFPSLNVDRGSAYLYDGQRINEFNARHDKLAAEIRARRPADNYVACLTEPADHQPPTHVFFRGDINQPRDTVEPGDLSILPGAAPIAADDPSVATSGRRLAWARQLTSGRHPLVARVLVNRVWMHHFGRGIVATAGDFGRLGERPSHPELLDWLADELVASGWKLKALHRLLVTSAAYRQTSAADERLRAIDPDNRLLGRMGVRRLEAEAIRDAILEVSGARTRTMFGPPSLVNPDEVGQVIVGSATRDGNGILVAASADDPAQFRRSIYVQVRRSMPLGVMEPFDVAATAPNCDQRGSSTAAPQSLLMMNNEFVVRQSERFASRVAADVGEDPAAQLRRAWLLAYGQEPVEADLAAGQELIAAARAHYEQLAAASPADPATASAAPLSPTQQALAIVCQALLSSNRFLYVD
jgi:hypothetical protein